MNRINRLCVILLVISLFTLSTEVTANPTSEGELKQIIGISSFVEGYSPMPCIINAAPSEALIKEPNYLSTPKYCALKLGNGQDSIITIALDEPRGLDPKIYIDKNNDEDLTNDEGGKWGSEYTDAYVNFTIIVKTDYNINGINQSLDYAFTIYRFKDRYLDRLFYFRDCYMDGSIELAGNTHRLAIIDDDADGLYNDLSDGSFYIDVDLDSILNTDSDTHEFYQMNQPFNIGGETYRIESVSPPGDKVNIGVSEIKVDPIPPLVPGYPAIDFTMKDLNGKDISLKDYQGKVVMLDFWATWCGPCIAEMPNVKNVYNKYKDRGFEIIGISLDTNLAQLKNYISYNNLTYPQLYDGNGWNNAIAELYRVHSIPKIYLIDGDGIIRYKDVRGKSLDEAVNRLTSKDNIPPDPITDLSAVDSDNSSVTLAWTATGDDGKVGLAKLYDIRYSKDEINKDNFDNADKVLYPFVPSPIGLLANVPGFDESFRVNGLEENTEYYFAIKVSDWEGNWSDISNVISYSTEQVIPDEIGSWTKKADMPTARGSLSTSVVDGKIYAIGGFGDFEHLSTVEEYDPLTDTWVKKADMPTPRSFLSTIVYEGKIYAFGGKQGSNLSLNTVEVYDPVNDTWAKKANMPISAHGISTSIVGDKIYMFGGQDLGTRTIYSSAYEYDPLKDTWLRKSDMKAERFALGTVDFEGKIYAFGGLYYLNITRSYVERYDPETDQWELLNPMPSPNSEYGVAVVNGKAYIMGGTHDDVGVYSRVDIYDLKKDVWTKAISMPTARSNVCSNAIGGKIYVFGGYDGRQVIPTVEEYDTGFVVKPENQPPAIAYIDNQTIDEDGVFDKIILDDFVSDPDNTDEEMIWSFSGNTNLSVNIDENRVASVTVSDPEWNGEENITFKVTDPEGLDAEIVVKFTVRPVNDPPMITEIPDQIINANETFEDIKLDDYVSDPDNSDDEIIWKFSGNTNLSIIQDNRIAKIRVLESGWGGTESITFTAMDPGGLSDSKAVKFTVNITNAPPVISDIPDQAVDEGQPFDAIKLDDYVSDPDNADTEIVWEYKGNSKLTVDIGDDHIATISPLDAEWYGEETITFTAKDTEGLTASDTVKFTVNAVNDAPLVSDIPDQAVNEAQPFDIIKLDDYVSDPDNADTEIVWEYTGNSKLTINISDDHIATISPLDAEWSGEEIITFTAKDTGSLTASDTVKFTVNAVNDPPLVSDIPDQVIVKGKSFAVINLDDFVNDPDNPDEEISWVCMGEDKLKVSIGDDHIASIAITDPKWIGCEKIKFVAKDLGGLTSEDEVEFAINVLLGDVSNNDSIDLEDVIMILRIAVGILKPDEYQILAADINADGRIRSDDAIKLLQMIFGLGAPGMNAFYNSKKPIALDIHDLHGIEGDKVIFPIKIDDTTLLAGGYISLSYNPGVLKATKVNPVSDVLLSSKIEDSGIIKIAFAGKGRLGNQTLARVEFRVISDNISPLDIKEVNLYGFDGRLLDSIYREVEFSSWNIAPKSSALLQNYPNPFNPETWIPYQLKEASDVKIRIYSVLGELVRELDLGYRSAGTYISLDRAAYWDGKNSHGIPAANGVYFYSIQAGDFSDVRKFIVLK